MEKIKRKTMLYKTGVEYGDYTINHVQGCAHGCKFPCYAMMMAKRFGTAKTYEEWCVPKLAENALEILEREIPRLKDKIESVHLCFSTDPFMYGYDEVSTMSIEIIRKLNAAGIKCTALTKGILPMELAQLSPENEYGITLVSLDEGFRKEMEPNTASYQDRIASLRALHDAGCKTWVSIEPYPTPNFIEQDLNKILEAISFCDKIIFGRLNYNKKVSEYKNHKAYFNELAEQVIAYCEANDKQYHIKDGTITEQPDNKDKNIMEDFILIRPTSEYTSQIAEYRQEFLDAGDSMDGTGPLRRFENPEEYIKTCAEYEDPEKVPSHLVPATQFFFVRKSDNKLVGMIQVRHRFNDFLEKYAGHIGYSVRPSERRRGYAKEMLKMTLPFCRQIGIDKVLITCIDGNIGSEKTILANGGVYESTVHEPNENEHLKRFWITL